MTTKQRKAAGKGTPPPAGSALDFSYPTILRRPKPGCICVMCPHSKTCLESTEERYERERKIVCTLPV